MAEEYTADAGLVALWLSLSSVPLPIAVTVWIERGWNVAGELFIASSILPVLLLVFVCRFKVVFTDRELVYHRWGPTIRIAYSDIAGLEVTNETPLGHQAIGAFVVAKNGTKYPFWPKLFPKRAVEKFFELGPVMR